MKHTNYTWNNISFSTPLEANIAVSDYITSVKSLIQKEREVNPTIVLHTDEEIQAKYPTSIVALLHNQEIIWNSSIYPSKMSPFGDLVLLGQQTNVWEAWSTIIHPHFRWRRLGTQLMTHSVQRFIQEYDMIVWATVNDIMYSLLTKLWFEDIPFPQELYQEWKKYLAPLMPQWDFEKKAKCIMLNKTLSDLQKIELILILQKENK